METRKAGFWMRVSALTIDEIILVVMTYALLQIIKPLINADLLHSIWFIIIFYEFLDYNYYTLFWVFGGQTPGKKIMKTKLIKVDGTNFTYKDAFIRYWTWMVGIAPLGVGYFWIALNKNKQGWNDIMAKTYVIRLS